MLEGKLEGEGRKNLLKITAVLEVPGTEETGPKLSTLESFLGE